MSSVGRCGASIGRVHVGSAGISAGHSGTACRSSSTARGIILSLLMILSGCTAIELDDDAEGTTTIEEQAENQPPTLAVDGGNWTSVSEMILTITGIVVDENPASVVVEVSLSNGGIVIVPDTFSKFAEVDAGGGLILSLILSQVGEYSIEITILDESGESSDSVTGVITVTPPDESSADISAAPILELPEPDDVTISGVVIHDYLNTCQITTIAQNGTEIVTTPSQNGAFALYVGFVEDDAVVYLNVTCGQWTISNNSIRVRIYVEDTGDDLDGDGVPNEQDSCPEGMGQANGWVANNETDIDSDGCHDGFEDPDDDGDDAERAAAREEADPFAKPT